MNVLTYIAILSVIIWILIRRKQVRLHRFESTHGEHISVVGNVAGKRMLFIVDTGFAGAPVLSKMYMAFPTQGQSWEDHYDSVVRSNATEREKNASLGAIQCRSFTSGCRMRLETVAGETERHVDLLLCSPLFPLVTPFSSDLFVTQDIKSVHILTCDYLLHRAPAIISPKEGTLRLALSPIESSLQRHTFHLHAAKFAGGAFVVPAVINGHDATLVVDTGATTGIVLTEEFAAQIEARWKPSSSIQDAHGIEIKTMHANLNVHFSRYDLGTVCVTATDTHMNGADGYIGMKVLRAFDIWLTPSEIGFRSSGLLPNESDQSPFKASGCKGTQCTLA